jgi:NADP-dependent 3-hydroxy acid dehydrogenase YdfG
MSYLDQYKMGTHLHRWRFNLVTGKTTEQRLDNRILEFGMFNQRYATRPYRYAYSAVQVPGWFLFHGYVKHDLQTGESWEIRLPEGQYASEAPFAPRVNAKDEDDGYLVTFVTNEKTQRSEALLIDCKRFTDGPVCRIELPHKLCSGTHSCWANGADIREGVLRAHDERHTRAWQPAGLVAGVGRQPAGVPPPAGTARGHAARVRVSGGGTGDRPVVAVQHQVLPGSWFLALYMRAGVIAGVLLTAVWLISLLKRDTGIMDVAYPLAAAVPVVVLIAQRGSPGRPTRYSPWCWWRCGAPACRCISACAMPGTAKMAVMPPGASASAPHWWWWSFFQVFMMQGVTVWLWSHRPDRRGGRRAPGSGLATRAGADCCLPSGSTSRSWVTCNWNGSSARTDRSQVLDTGLWRLTRHPNYFGESVVWWSFGALGLVHPWGWLALVCPLYVTWFMSAGSATPMQDRYLAKTKPAYADYMQSRSHLLSMGHTEVIPSTDLQGRSAIVTGAGKGLGRAYALHLAAHGASVLVNNRRHPGESDTQTSAAQTVAAIRAAGGTADANWSDVNDPESGPAMVQQALDKFGGLDIVVANAGVDTPTAFHKQSLADFRAIFDTGFFGNLHLAHAAWPHLLGQRYGRMVLTASSAGLHANHGQSAYSAAKAAVIGLMRSLAIEGPAPRRTGQCDRSVWVFADDRPLHARGHGAEFRPCAGRAGRGLVVQCTVRHQRRGGGHRRRPGPAGQHGRKRRHAPARCHGRRRPAWLCKSNALHALRQRQRFLRPLPAGAGAQTFPPQPPPPHDPCVHRRRRPHAPRQGQRQGQPQGSVKPAVLLAQALRALAQRSALDTGQRQRRRSSVASPRPADQGASVGTLGAATGRLERHRVGRHDQPLLRLRPVGHQLSPPCRRCMATPWRWAAASR